MPARAPLSHSRGAHMTAGPKPEFATNRPDERVADAINAHFAHLRTTWQSPRSCPSRRHTSTLAAMGCSPTSSTTRCTCGCCLVPTHRYRSGESAHYVTRRTLRAPREPSCARRWRATLGICARTVTSSAPRSMPMRPADGWSTGCARARSRCAASRRRSCTGRRSSSPHMTRV